MAGFRNPTGRGRDTVLGTHRQLETAGQAPWPRSGTRQVRRRPGSAA
jgi:hypothetical protein